MGIFGGEHCHVAALGLAAVHVHELHRSWGFARFSPTVVHALPESATGGVLTVGCVAAPASLSATVVTGVSLPDDAAVVVDVEAPFASVLAVLLHAATATVVTAAPSASARAKRVKWGSSVMVRRVR